jgi:hypothetical protein
MRLPITEHNRGVLALAYVGPFRFLCSVRQHNKTHTTTHDDTHGNTHGDTHGNTTHGVSGR